jgi:two-component system, OmpR family, copper resistance phosphate regulon response regulator CusR
MRILVVEDEADVAGFIVRGLIEEAYAVDHATDGTAALDMAAVNAYDAIVLDLAIPPPDGMEVCRRLRAGGNPVPILMLTARDTVDDKINGLDAGADDYLTKPFQFREFLARLRALLRRGGATTPSALSAGLLTLDTRSHRVSIGNQPLTLTTKEYTLLEYLMRNCGRIVTREEIAEHVWNEAFDPFSNLIEVYINRLRRHMEKVTDQQFIVTVRGAGYMLEGSPGPL